MKMWKTLLHFLLTLGLGIATGTAQAADRLITLDLSLPPGERTEQLAPDKVYAFETVNRVPQFRYSIRVQREIQQIEKIDPPGAAQPEGDSPCERISSIDSQLSAATEETAVARLAARAQRLIAEDQCKNPDVVNLLRETLAQTRERLGEEFLLSEGELIRITVNRLDGEAVREWIFIFNAPPRGNWFTSYGFTFLGDQDETFFSRETDSGFEIARDNQSGGELSNLSFAPSFFYTWLPRRDENRDLSPGFTFGLGFDQSNPVVFAGGSLNYNRNVSLIAGAAIHRQNRLNGQFYAGQPLQELLDDEALHEERFGINYFFGLSFRFNTNPFSSDDEDPAPAEPVEPAPGGDS